MTSNGSISFSNWCNIYAFMLRGDRTHAISVSSKLSVSVMPIFYESSTHDPFLLEHFLICSMIWGGIIDTRGCSGKTVWTWMDINFFRGNGGEDPQQYIAGASCRLIKTGAFNRDYMGGKKQLFSKGLHIALEQKYHTRPQRQQFSKSLHTGTEVLHQTSAPTIF